MIPMSSGTLKSFTLMASSLTERDVDMSVYTYRCKTVHCIQLLFYGKNKFKEEQEMQLYA